MSGKAIAFECQVVSTLERKKKSGKSFSHLLLVDGNRNCVNVANGNALLLQHFTVQRQPVRYLEMFAVVIDCQAERNEWVAMGGPRDGREAD